MLGAGAGGLSGPAIRPVALRSVREIAGRLEVVVIGCGGAASAEDVLAFVLAGASAVQVGTAILRDPVAATAIVEELGELLAEVAPGEPLAALVGALEEGGQAAGWAAPLPGAEGPGSGRDEAR